MKKEEQRKKIPELKQEERNNFLNVVKTLFRIKRVSSSDYRTKENNYGPS